MWVACVAEPLEHTLPAPTNADPSPLSCLIQFFFRIFHAIQHPPFNLTNILFSSFGARNSESSAGGSTWICMGAAEAGGPPSKTLPSSCGGCLTPWWLCPRGLRFSKKEIVSSCQTSTEHCKIQQMEFDP